MVKIKNQLVSQSVINRRSYGGGNPVENIVIHQTGNTNKGANARVHAKLQSNLNPRQASWQIQVDDKEAIQSFPDFVKCWAAGDGWGPGNTRSIHIEICINSDGDYKKAVANGAAVARIKMKEHGLGIKDVKQHRDFAKKNCPAQIRAGKDGITWADFLSMVSGSVVEQASKPKPTLAPSKPIVSKPSTNQTTSIVDYLNSKKVNSSPANRRKLAIEYGVKNYDLTAAKNTELLNKMRSGKPTPKPKPVAKKNTVTLPKSAKTWRTYKTNVQPVKANSDWSLTPSAFGGITYEILGRPYANVVTVNTSRGKRNIFVGPGTGAVIK